MPKMNLLVEWLSVFDVRVLNTFASGSQTADPSGLWTKGRGLREKLWSQIDFLCASQDAKGIGKPLLTSGRSLHRGFRGSDHRPVSALVEWQREVVPDRSSAQKTWKGWRLKSGPARQEFHEG